ncbi:LuxR C-terminal-related transcriptional regulator [Streptomyces sp. NPDC050617]|uniref:helix-turn-helix transcriptional regulator n=1 Tax=Streptomyces sp. NPDC050617 TaxID=3154628 RepID=UPI0034473100
MTAVAAGPYAGRVEAWSGAVREAVRDRAVSAAHAPRRKPPAAQGVRTLLPFLGVQGNTETVYRAMLRHQELSVEELAARLSLSTDDIRAALDVLFDCRLLRESYENPGQLFAVDPIVGLQELLARERQELLERQQRIADSQQLITRMLAENGRRTVRDGTVRAPAGDESGAERLDGLTAVRRRIEQLVCNASRTVATFMQGGAQPPSSLAAARRNDESVLRRGAAVRTIGLDAIRRDPATLDYARWLTARGGEFRTTASLPPGMVLVDSSTALLPIDPADTGKGALCLTRPGVVASLVALFECVWDVATPLGADREAGRAGLSEPERELLLLIARGHTDESAAAQLFISPRTTRRMMASLMERLGARSRFEAGVKAAQHGWL